MMTSPAIVDARLAGGHIRVEATPRPGDGAQMVRLAGPGFDVLLFDDEARELAAALAHTLDDREAQRRDE